MSPAAANTVLVASLAEEIRQAAGFLASAEPPSRAAMRERLQALRDAASMAGIPAAQPALESAERLVALSNEDQLGEQETRQVLRHLEDLHAGLVDAEGSDAPALLSRIGNLSDTLQRLAETERAHLRRLLGALERAAAPGTASRVGSRHSAWREAEESLSELRHQNLRLMEAADELQQAAGWLAAQAATIRKEPLARLVFEWRRLAREASRTSHRPASLEVRCIPGGVARERIEPLQRLAGTLIRQAILELPSPEERRRERRDPVAALRLSLEAEDWRFLLRLSGFPDVETARRAQEAAREDAQALGAVFALAQEENSCALTVEWLDPPAVCQAIRLRAGRFELLLPLQIVQAAVANQADVDLPPTLPDDELCGGPASTVFVLRCGSYRGALPARVLRPPVWVRLRPLVPPAPPWAVALAQDRRRTLPVLHPWFFCRVPSPGAAPPAPEKGALADG